MAIYFLMGVTIVLTGIAALQLFYMGFLERQSKDHKRRIIELEKHSARLSRRLNEAEETLIRQADTIQAMEYYEEEEEMIAAVVAEEEEVWADVIDSE